MSKEDPEPVDLAIRPIAADDAAAIKTYVALRNAITPDNADSVVDAGWEDATYPGQVFRLLAWVGDEPVAAATTGRLHIFERDHPAFYIGCWVLPAWRRRGIGSALLDAAAIIARDQGKTEFRTWVSERHTDGIAFLRRRGFEEIGRDKSVRLPLAGLAAPAIDPPPGIAVTRLADRPDLREAVWQVAAEAFPSIPHRTTPVSAGSFEDFAARDIDRVNIRPGLFAIAIVVETGEVAGYASLKLDPADPSLAFHDMTAVRPAFRNRGIATALKRATIAWAIEAGLRELETGNDEANLPMRTVNRRLGYTPLPDYVALRGPLFPVDGPWPGTTTGNP
jgi:GNAT superfamily N-acetyltransferase